MLKSTIRNTRSAEKCSRKPKYTTMMTAMNAHRMAMNLPWVIR